MMARRVIAGRGGFNPKALFSANEQGVWYDPSDFSTLFQDAAGTTPVTAAEQPVGLMLDKSKGLVLGPELVTNGDFSTGTMGWSAYQCTLAVTSGQLVVTSTVAGNGYVAAYQTLSGLTAGKSYQITVGTVQSGYYTVYDSSIASTALLPGSNASGSQVFIAPSDGDITINLFFASSSIGQTATFDNISVRELPGNHAYQTTSANRPTLSARYNLLTATERYNDATVWLDENGSRRQTVDYLPGAHNVFVVVKKTTSAWIAAGCQQSGGAKSFAWFNLDTGQAGSFNGIISSLAIQPFGTDGYYKCSFVINQPSAIGAQFYLGSTIGNGVIANGAALLLLQSDLRVANDGVGLPPYQRVNTATDYDTVGFPLYLRFNGSTQFLQTNSIDFSSTDKVLVAAGVRKLSDAATGVLTELSASIDTNNGVFVVGAPGGSLPLDRYIFVSKGTAPQFAQSGNQSVYYAPVTNTLTGLGDISGDRTTLRVNGSQAAQSTNDQGTGNYGNYPLYIGARGGSSMYFNGHLYSLIVRGAQTPANLIAATERYIARKTGVTL